jgi:hypothetical protein
MIRLFRGGLDAILELGTRRRTDVERKFRYRLASIEHPEDFMRRRAIGVHVREAFRANTKPDLPRIRALVDKQLGIAP